MNVLDRLVSYFGYTKAQVDNAPAWLRATANARRFEVPEYWLATNQLELYQRLSWVAIAVGAVASTAATAALNVKQVEGEDTVDIPNHPLEMTLMRPNPLQSRYEFIEATFLDRALTGNAYWWLNRASKSAAPSELWAIPPNRIRPVPDGNLYLRGYMYDPGDGLEIPLEPWEIVHFKRYHSLNPFVGLSPIEALATVAQGDLAMQKWNTNFFAEDNAKVPGALAFADPIDEGRWQAMKADIREQHGGTKRNMMMLRNVGKGGVQWVSMAMSQKDMEFLAAREFNKEEIFALFAPGLASVLAINATEANSDAGKKTFLDMAVWPQMVAVAEKITNDLLPTYGEKLLAEFDDIRITDRVLELSEQEAFAKVHTVDEVRAKYYQADPLGDDRGKLLVPEVTHGLTRTSEPAAPLPPALAVDNNEGVEMSTGEEEAEDAPTVDEMDDPEAVKAVEIEKYQRWCEKRKQPDPARFKSDILTDEEKAALLAQWYPAKATLQLSPDDDEAERDARMETERRAGENLAAALDRQRAELIGTDPEAITDALTVSSRVDETGGTVRDALRRMLIESVDLGVSVSVGQFQNIGYGFDWTLANEKARQWANQYTGELITQINDTTRRQVQAAVSEWISNGEPLEALIRELEPAFGRRRAELIASTETTKAYAEAQKQSYRESGVIQKMEWRTAEDERVCPVCGPLAGRRAEFDEEFEAGISMPPAHPGCRCWLVPAVD